ncbi:Uncharacterised protein [Klebsiella pneumoniae]|uniref:Uncharacterized protein n=1 Tax=Klebsiella pneumoniae TaxID=573 RepID=A0A378ACU3_KLEPN|nr:Uncharacterised protein [Klebsiella pneumoniae]
MLSKKIILISTITLCFSIVGCKEEAKTTNGIGITLTN